MRIVLDTNILVRANPKALPHGLARELLLSAIRPPHALILSVPILAEVERVLQYPRVAQRWPLPEGAINRYVSLLAAASITVELPANIPTVLADPDDDPILQTAISGHADVLCTRDSAFHHPIVLKTCSANRIRIVDDITLMQELRELASSQP